MITANISVLGLYVYDPTIFDGLAVPDGVNLETVVQNLLAELSGLEIIYPDAEFMRKFIPVWSAKELPVWQKLYNTTVLEYDPIMNYDRTEEWTESRRGNDTINDEVSGSESFESAASMDGNSYSKVAAYNSLNLENHEGTTTQNQNSGNSQNDISETRNGTRATTENVEVSRRAYGNIGVTTTQQMIEQEREIALFNIYDTIIQSFKYRFCVLVY